MKKIGIDFSLNSTAICINDNDKYSFINIVNTKSFYGKKNNVLKEFKIHNEIKDKIIIICNERQKYNLKDYNDEQLQKLKDYNKLIDIIISHIDKNSIIGLEGFSYSSNGKSFIDLIMAQTLLRQRLILENYNLKILSPSTIKKIFTGKGNSDKINMFNQFKKENLFNNELYNYIINNSNNLIIKNKLLKPIDDLIDAYAITKTIKTIDELVKKS